MLASLLDRHAAERPRAAALVAGRRTLTWEELKDLVARTAAGLEAQGVERGEVVGLLLPNVPEFVAAFLALARVGAQVLPLSTDWRPDQVRAALVSAGSTRLVAPDGFGAVAESWRHACVECRVTLATTDRPGSPALRTLARGASAVVASLPDGDHALLQQFTSGSTGPPCRVMRTHGSLTTMTATFARATGISADDRVLAMIPFCHGHGLNNTLLTALHAGATVVLLERFDRREALRLVAGERITVMPVVPFIANVLAGTATAEADLRSLRLSITGGSTLTRDTWLKTRARLGIELRQSYGSTETGLLTFDDGFDPDPECVGRPLEGVVLRPVDASGQPLPSNGEGPVAVRSPWAARWRSAGEGPQPVAGSDGWIRMVDVGRLGPDGRLWLTGNDGIMINVAGRKVNPEDVERTLAAHPKVREAAVFARRDGFAEQSVHAVVVAAAGCTPDELLAHCRARLADYQVPRVIRFAESLPRSAAGKIIRSTLG